MRRNDDHVWLQLMRGQVSIEAATSFINEEMCLGCGRLSCDLRSVVTFGVDCLGTFAPTEYAQRVKARGVEAVTCEALCYAAEGGFTPQMFRTACQACDWPAPQGAEVVIGAIGIDPARYSLVIARDEATDSRLNLNAVIGELAVEAQVERREIAVGDVVDMRAKRRESLLEGMSYAQNHHSDIASALAWLANCSFSSRAALHGG